MLRTILKKNVCKNVLLTAIDAFWLRFFVPGGICDGMEIFIFFSFLHGWARRDFDSFDAAREQADGISKVMA